jgi:hypothetical protein
LQFDDRLLEIELVSHTVGRLNTFHSAINANSINAKKRPDLRPAPAVTRFKRLHRGAQKGGATNLGSLFEPRHEQNLYANPKRTAKSFICYNCIDQAIMQMVQKFVKYFCAF